MLTPNVTQIQPASPYSQHIIEPDSGSGAMLIEAQDIELCSKQYDELHLGVSQYA